MRGALQAGISAIEGSDVGQAWAEGVIEGTTESYGNVLSEGAKAVLDEDKR